MTGYRCEEFFGKGRRDAASVMAHETFVLEDTDILDYLIKSNLIGETMKELLLVYVEKRTREQVTVCQHLETKEKEWQKAIKDLKIKVDSLTKELEKRAGMEAICSRKCFFR